jgi:hypothetical protein
VGCAWNITAAQAGPGTEVISISRSGDVWPLAEGKVAQHVAQGSEAVLVMRLGAYIEFQMWEVLRFLQGCGQFSTRVCGSRGPLDFWIVRAAHRRKSGVRMWKRAIAGSESGTPYLLRGYVNPLAEMSDLRRLASDAFLGRCRLRPRGKEIRPRIWIDEASKVDRGARVVAPAYIGRNTKVQSGAVITRRSTLERNCRIACGTVVEDASVLPSTSIGRYLDVSHAVVDGSVLVNLERNVAVSIADPLLVSRTFPFRVPGADATQQPPVPAYAAAYGETGLPEEEAWLPSEAEAGPADAIA